MVGCNTLLLLLINQRLSVSISTTGKYVTRPYSASMFYLIDLILMLSIYKITPKLFYNNFRVILNILNNI